MTADVHPSAKEIDKSIFRLATPAIFSNITVPLLGLSDTWISGHLGSETFLAAIAVGTMMVNALYWLLGFLRAGTTGLTAEALGSGNHSRRRDIFTASFLLAISLGLCICLLSYPLCRLMLLIMEPAPETAALAQSYFMICVFAAPALLATMTVSGWMIGSQNTLYPMIIAISVNVINIILSFSLVFFARIGFYGVAIGTLCANWAGLFIALFLSRRLVRKEAASNTGNSQNRHRLWAPVKGLARRLDLRRFFKVNSDLMMRSACIMAVTFAMTSFGGRMGNLTLAINAIIMQLFLFFSYFTDGFAYAAEALCGRFSGAHDPHSLRRSIGRLFIWASLTALIFFLAYSLAVNEIATFLTDTESVAEGVSHLRWVLGLIPPVSAAAFLLDGIFIGLTATRRMLAATFIAAAAFFLITLTPTFVAGDTPLPESIFNPILWSAFLIFLILRSILLATFLKTGKLLEVGAKNYAI